MGHYFVAHPQYLLSSEYPPPPPDNCLGYFKIHGQMWRCDTFSHVHVFSQTVRTYICVLISVSRLKGIL